MAALNNPYADLTKNDKENKHNLEHTWVLWYDNPKNHSKDKAWIDNLEAIAVFDTAEDFWSAYNYIKRPSELENACSYFVFKKNILPEWECEGNKQGGVWNVTFQPTDSKLDEYWESVILSMIGECLESPGEELVCGARFQNRKRRNEMKISLWANKSVGFEEGLTQLGKKFKDVMGINSFAEFVPHNQNKGILTA